MFEELFLRYPPEQVKRGIYESTGERVQASLQGELRNPADFYALFSPAADPFLEAMAAISSRITRTRFGRIIQLYAPLYVSNECTNSCVYCGFNVKNPIRRITLSPGEVEEEADSLFRNGFRHILLVSGENRKSVPLSLLSEIAQRIHRRFASVSIEVYPMEEEEYGEMIRSGVDGLTLYQETYDRVEYARVHPAGKKRDFSWRLAAPDRAGRAGMRRIGVGALLGLSDWRVEGFYTALHAFYLTGTYWRSQIQVSFPRLRRAAGGYEPPCEITDRDLTHLVCALRLILPDAGLVLSTRESPRIRDNLFPLGITMMSAGSKTEPGGYTRVVEADEQFSVEDSRPPEAIAELIRSRGFDPVWKDWDRDFL